MVLGQINMYLCDRFVPHALLSLHLNLSHFTWLDLLEIRLVLDLILSCSVNFNVATSQRLIGSIGY